MSKIQIMHTSEPQEYIDSLDRKAIYELLYSELMYVNFISFNRKNIKDKRFHFESHEEAFDSSSRKSNLFCIKNTNNFFLNNKERFTEKNCMHVSEPEDSLFQPEYEVIEKSNNKYKVVVTCAINGNFKEKLFMYAPNEKTARCRAELAMRHKIVPHEIKD